jgi:hypothetical protein
MQIQLANMQEDGRKLSENTRAEKICLVMLLHPFSVQQHHLIKTVKTK